LLLSGLRPHHRAEQAGVRYVIDVDRMSARVVSDDVWEALGRWPEAPSPAVMAALAELELLADPPVRPAGEGRARTRAADPPVWAMALFLTQTCNLDCVYCYGGTGAGDGGTYGSRGTMRRETAFAAVDWLIARSRDMKVLTLSFFGGEPLLAFDLLKEVVLHAERRAAERDKRFSFDVTTNGTLLDDAKVAFFDAHDVGVTVSFDGERALQDAQRPFKDGRGSYDETAPRLVRLLRVRPERSAARATLLGDRDPREVKRSLLAMGFSDVGTHHAAASLFDAGGRPSRQREAQVARSVEEMEREAAEWVEALARRDGEALRRLAAEGQLGGVLRVFLNGHRRRYNCRAARAAVGVSAAGDVYPCHRFVGQDAYRMGTVFDPALDRAPYLDSPLDRVDACRACVAKHLCAGGCMHENLAETGSLEDPVPALCRRTRRMTELVAYIAIHVGDETRSWLAAERVVPPKPCPYDF